MPAQPWTRFWQLALGVIVFTLVGHSAAGAQVIVAPPRAQAPVAVESDVYLVTFRPGTPVADRAAAVARSGGNTRQVFTSINALSVRMPNAAAVARLRSEAGVLSVFQSRPISLAVAPQNGRGGGGGNAGGGSGGGGGGGKRLKAPSGLTATATSSSEIALGWNDTSKDETGFSIERCAGAGCVNFLEIVRVGTNVTGHLDEGLAPDTLYRYRAVTTYAGGSSDPSEIAEAATDAEAPAETPPAAPTALTADAQVLATYQVALGWNDNADNENGFRVERCDQAMGGCGAGDFVEIATPGVDATGYTDVLVDPDHTYTYRVLAFNAMGDSAYSNMSDASVPSGGEGDQVVPYGVSRIGAAPGNLSVTGAGVGVAIVDTGLDFNHPDLGLEAEIPGFNAFNAFGGSCQDFHGHGTHVGGIVAAKDNMIDVVGVAPDATLYCVNVFANDPVEGVVATDESLVAGLDWIALNADTLDPPVRVVNMSLGRPRTPDDDNPGHPLRQAIAHLHSLDIAIAVAAGNDPTREVFIEVPASYPEAIAVASTAAISGVNGYDDLFTECVGIDPIGKDTASYFTTDGAFDGVTGVTVSAPGDAQENIFFYQGTCYLDPVGILSTSLGGGTERLMGTSMASPHVAGVLALMWQVELDLGVELDPELARSRIRNTADRPGTAPLDSPILEYTFDGAREGIVWAPAAVGEAPPPTPDFAPTVRILTPSGGTEFSSGEIVTFEATATDIEEGDVAADLIWTSSIDGAIGLGGSFATSLSNGNHHITASVEDSAENVASDSVSIVVGEAGSPLTVSVSSVVYNEIGPNLLVTIGVSDEFGNPVVGALVTAELIEFFYTLADWDFAGTTNSQGKVQFQLNNAPIGCYITDVTDITGAGAFDGTEPASFYCM